MSYQIVIECINYYGSPSPERIDFVERYLKESLGNVNKVRMFESEVTRNVIMPQILIYYNDENPESYIRNIDSVMARIGLTTTRAVVLKVTTRAAEGAIVGGVGGSLATSKKKTFCYMG